MNTARKLLASAAVLLPGAMAIAPSVAHATPYASASNDITGLTVTYSDGTSIPAADISSATTNVSDGAVFNSPTGVTNQNAGAVGSALSIPQAYSGPGPTPPASFTALGPGAFTGTRGDAAISAGNAASGGVSVMNIAEGYGPSVGNSFANDSSSITFTVVGTGKAVQLSFSDAFALTASTAPLAQEVGTSAISNTFSVTPSGSSTPIFTYQPSTINTQLSSQDGVPPTNSDSGTFTSGPIDTPTLLNGVVYTISLSSSSAENIAPGVPTPVPEPASIAILGAGLLGLGLTFRRKRG